MEDLREQRQAADTEIKALLRGYDPSDKQRNRRLLELLWPLIERQAALLAVRRDDWVRETFLSEVAQRLPEYLLEYREQRCLFTTWFIKVLRHSWCRNKWRFARVESNAEVFSEWLDDEGEPDKGDAEILEGLLGCLTGREALYLRIRYPELLGRRSLEELRESGLIAAERFIAFCRRVDEILQRTGVRNGHLQNKLDRLYCRRFRAARRGAPRQRLYELSRHATLLAERLRGGLARMSYNEMAEFLAIPSGSVASALFRIRYKLRKARNQVSSRGSERQVS